MNYVSDNLPLTMNLEGMRIKESKSGIRYYEGIK